MNKKIAIGFASVLIAAAIVGSYFYPASSTRVITNYLAGSAAGSTFSTRKVAEQVVTTSTSTVYSILNTDTATRTITSMNVFLTNGNSTTSNYLIQCATSTSASSIVGNTNYIANFTISGSGPSSIYGTTTTAGEVYISSSSPGITGTSTQGTPTGSFASTTQFARVWAPNTYLNCSSLGSTGNLIDSNVQGYIAFPYDGN